MATGQPERARLKVFISYSRVDESFAEDLRLGLEDKGYPVEIDKHSIRQGEEWRTRLGNLIAESGTVVFVLSPDSARSDVCYWEVEEAHRQGKRIVPVLHRGLNEPPRGQQPDGSPWPEGPAKAPDRLTLINYPRFDEGRSFMKGLFDLIGALEADYDWIDRHNRLATLARDWDQGGRPANRLMSGADIAAAKSLVETRKPSAPPILPVQLDFIQSSEAHEAEQRSARERELAEREQLLKEREMAVQQEAAARAAQADADARALRAARRTTRVTVDGLAVALLPAESLPAGSAGTLTGSPPIWRSATWR